MNLPYDKIPIQYRRENQFVDPTTQQTHSHAAVQNYSDRIEKLFQLDMNQEDSRYSLTTGLVHQDKPVIFGPQYFHPVASHSFTGAQDARMYARNELRGFWDSILTDPFPGGH